MKRIVALLLILILAGGTTLSAYSPVDDCSSCDTVREQPYVDPYNPAAPLCGTDCGLSVCSVAAAIAAVIGVAALILASPSVSHSH